VVERVRYDYADPVALYEEPADAYPEAFADKLAAARQVASKI
jgi:hypothetical protein